jgi:hypothetical protein
MVKSLNVNDGCAAYTVYADMGRGQMNIRGKRLRFGPAALIPLQNAGGDNPPLVQRPPALFFSG